MTKSPQACPTYLASIYHIGEILSHVLCFIGTFQDNGALFIFVLFIVPSQRIFTVISKSLSSSFAEELEKTELYFIGIFNAKSRFQSTKRLSFFFYSWLKWRLQDKMASNNQGITMTTLL